MGAKGFVDIHCHILPKVDDGAQSLEEALAMLKLAYEDGIRGILVTPHVYPGRFECTREELTHALACLEQCNQMLPEPLELKLGCELRVYSEAVEEVSEGKIPTMADSPYVLLEFAYGVDGRTMIHYVRQFAAVGYWPIVAHVERYPVVQKDRHLVDDLIDQGAYIQLNAADVLGAQGFSVKRLCKQLIKNDSVHFIASDGHRQDHRLPQLGDCYRKVCKWFGEPCAEQLMKHNPAKVMAGISLDE